MVSLQHRDNAGVLRHLRGADGDGTRPPASQSPDAVADPCMTPGTHPDVVRAIDAGARLHHAYGDGSRLDLAAIGTEWVLGGWRREEPDWCLAAYAHAGRR